jgi:uncharacterized iron-regulated membrane protein
MTTARRASFRSFRNQVFSWHRYIGLAVGIVLAIVGLTGSILVFYPEMDHAMLTNKVGQIAEQGDRISVAAAIETVEAAYRDRPEFEGFTVSGVDSVPNRPYGVYLALPDEKPAPSIYVDPYNGQIMGETTWDGSFFDIVFRLHYTLLAGTWGTYFIGVIGLLATFLCLSGIILWPGWRKLSTGFKIKWDAKTKRLNFDIHKVAGIVAAVFLAMATFTGFCWNFWDWSVPAIHALTFSPKPAEAASTLVANQSSLPVAELLQRAEAALPGTQMTYVELPAEPEATFHTWAKYPNEKAEYNSEVQIDQYSGEVLLVKDSHHLSRADLLLNSFTPVHYGTFGGLPTRILYIFVGLSPTILLVTGFIMWRLRKQNPPQGKSRTVEQKQREMAHYN